jgi:hypothetical protein
LSEKRRATKEVEVDFDRLARVGNKLNELLIRKTNGTAEAYAVLRFLCVWYEESLGVAFAPEFENELHNVVKKCIEGGTSEPTESP